MWTWFRSRAKAFAVPFVAGLTLACIKGFEAASGIDVPADQETAIVAWSTALIGGLVVERVSNG